MIDEEIHVFGSGNKDKLKQAHRWLNRAVRKEKLWCKEKLEKYFTANSMSQVWQGLRRISGYTWGDNRSCQQNDS